MKRQARAVRRPPATPVRRVDFLLHREMEMGDTRREMDRDIDDNQSVNIINFGFYKNNIFSVTDDKSEQTQIGKKTELFMA